MIYVGILIISGILGGQFAKLLKAPSVTGYLLAGIIVGPAVLNIVDNASLNQTFIFSEIALAMIAFTIGAEFNYGNMKKLGRDIFIIAITQALVTFIFVFGVCYFYFAKSLSFSLLLGAISCATAPAATVMVINQYRADGPLVRTILPVVAIDDAICIIVFGIAVSLSKTTQNHETLSLIHMIWEPFIEISGSLLLGALVGILYSLSHRFFQRDEDTLIVTFGSVILTSGIAVYFNFSSLLACMMVGAAVANLLRDRKRIFNMAERFCPPFYILFFTIAGATLHLNELRHIGMLGILYILTRTIGKILGSALGAKAVSASPNIVKYLGLGLLPQAGVAIGLVTIANASFPAIGSQLMTIVLGGVVFFEILGPFSAKYALQKAGEINQRGAVQN